MNASHYNTLKKYKILISLCECEAYKSEELLLYIIKNVTSHIDMKNDRNSGLKGLYLFISRKLKYLIYLIEYFLTQMAQLIKDEKQRYDKIEMLFKSREKSLNDRTKKLVKLEEQKRALRDTGQDSRISSVKKKQRALLLKLQQEKDEMNR
jgi:hypothetical protein